MPATALPPCLPPLHPRRRRSIATVVVLTSALVVAACGSGDAQPADDAGTSLAVGSLPEELPASTTSSIVIATLASTPDQTTAPEEGPVQIDVVVGRDSGPGRVERVRVGADITLNITNPAAADEFHLHGIELESRVDAGVMATFNFLATTAGTYEVESHETDGVLVVIEVVP